VKTFIFLLLTFLNINSFSQAKSYETIKIANWVLEKFPKHYLIKAAKVYTEKDKYTGKLTFYQEIDEYGQPEGLTVKIQRIDYTSPAEVYYYYKGVTVYRAQFFSRSTKAFEIVNKNLNENLEGPHVYRELINNKVQENITIYKNGKSEQEIEVENLIKKNTIIHLDNDSLLDGFFKFQYTYGNNERYCSGRANHGILDSIQIIDSTELQQSWRYVIKENILKKFVKTNAEDDFSYLYESFQVSKLVITWSKNYYNKFHKEFTVYYRWVDSDNSLIRIDPEELLKYFKNGEPVF
jgi:hypothetical protein